MSNAIKENLIINQLVVNKEYRDRTLPYLKEEYFSNQYSKILFESVKTYIEKYLVAPSKEALIISLKQKVTHFSEENLKELSETIDDEIFNQTSIHNEQWLLDTTEEFCKNQSVYNAIVQSIDIYEGNKKDIQKEVIPDLLKDALAISFDSKVGIDYCEEYDSQFDFYQRKEHGVSFDVPILNTITNGIGLPRKALTVLVSGTGGGKCSTHDTEMIIWDTKYGNKGIITIGEFFDEEICENSKVVDKKFLEIKDVYYCYVWTDTGWNKIVNVSKTIPYQLYEIKTSQFNLKCADEHIVFTEDFQEIYIRDLVVGQKIQTISGPTEIVEIIIHEQVENMYDLQLEEGNRRFYTNGILSHNTLAKCHFAASAIKQGFNVLYFTMEMAQERIAQRIDANLLDLDHNDVPFLSEEDYKKQMKAVKQFCRGKLIIKEFPTGSATSNHFKHIIEELKRKKNTKVDLMIVDYLNICSSSRYKATNGVNTYTILKCVAEEIRSLGMEYDMAVLSSAQVNRGNLNNLDMGLDGVSESMGITHTADLVWYLFRNDQLDALNRILVTQLKNRYDDLTKMKRFLIGVSRGKMQLFGVDSNETAVFLGSTNASGEEVSAAPEVNADHFKGRSQTSSKSFSDFKF